MNYKFKQIVGPFEQNVELVSAEVGYIQKIGIQSAPPDIYINENGQKELITHKVLINNKEYEIGKTGILEYNDVKITSLKFLQNENGFTIVDMIIGE